MGYNSFNQFKSFKPFNGSDKNAGRPTPWRFVSFGLASQ